MDKVKICHVTSVHKSTDIRIFEKECTSLTKLEGCSVYLVAPGESYVKNNVVVFGVGTPPKSRIARMFSFSKAVMQKALEVDAHIYHLHDPELLQFVKILKRNQKFVIFDSHEDVAEDILDKEYIPNIARRCISSLYRHYSVDRLKMCDALVSVTPHIIEKLKKIHNNVFMITNYPKLEETDFHRDIFHKNIKKLIFAGTINSYWSHELIINTLQNVNDITYELFGPITDEYLNKLQVLDGWQKTNYHGVVPFREVQAALKECGIALAILQPSHGTAGNVGTLGNTKLFESMSAGLPVICTDFVLWKEIVEDNDCGICINANSAEELQSAIMYLINNPEKALQMGLNGHKAVLEKYNWSTQEKALFDMYDILFKLKNSF